MRSLKGATLVVAAVALVVAAQAAAGGPTTVSSVYTVGSQGVPGVDTGLVLTGGMEVTVTATGSVCPFGSGACNGPGGVSSWNTNQSSYGGFVLPGAPAWGLVGKVGDGPWVQVGSGSTLTGTGTLVFAVNDDLFGDNAGSFTVTVSYSCWPGWGYGDRNHTHCGPPGLVGKSDDVPTESTPSTGPGKRNGNGNGKALGHSK
jgi:hypothetical protein